MTNRRRIWHSGAYLLLIFLAVFTISGGRAVAAFEPSGKLEIHYINVGQGGSTLIIGPDGTRILYDFGDAGAHHRITEYLKNTVKLKPKDGLHYAIVSHRDKDHYYGYRGVIQSGFDVLTANYGNGSPKTATVTTNREWLNPAKNKTSAGAVKPIQVGSTILLGKGAKLTVVAANGKVIGDTKDTIIDKKQKAKDENDRSIALFIEYGNFQYILDGDMGAGSETCTGRKTTQKDVQGRVAEALLKKKFITKKHGVDLMHVAHHGSESSTSADYFNMMKPETAVISVGFSRRRYYHPRKRVVDTVLLSTGSTRPDCLTAPPLKPDRVFQTEDGQPDKDGKLTSFAALAIGDIKVSTDGRSGYSITGNNNVRSGAKGAREGGWHLKFDEDGGGEQ